MKSFVLWCASIAIVALMIAVGMPKATKVFAAAGDVVGAAWSSNIGWIDLGNNGATYGVKMDALAPVRNLSGYAWSSNIGWVSFDNGAVTGCPSGTCQPRIEWGTAGGPSVLVKGWARACSVFASGCSGTLKADVGVRGGWDGFISLGDSKPTDGVSYGVKLNTVTGNATGFAWGSEVVGWVDFSGVKFDITGDPTETCSDGIQNQNETGVDTGGICASGTCSDGIQNQNETGVDTGGVCGGGGGDPVCEPGQPCWCVAHPTDTQNCPENCPSNPAAGTKCWCAISENAGDPRCQTVGGICTNIRDDIEQTLIDQGVLTNPVTPPYRMSTDGTGKCLCTAGYILNPVTFQCAKPVYTEH